MYELIQLLELSSVGETVRRFTFCLDDVGLSKAQCSLGLYVTPQLLSLIIILPVKFCGTCTDLNRIIRFVLRLKFTEAKIS